MRMIRIGLTIGLAVSSSALAHDGAMHKGKATHGTVVAVRGEQLMLTTEDGALTVTLTDKTKVERGEKEVERGELAPGTHVEVFGTKLPGGELVAQEVLLDAEGSRKDHDDDPDRHTH